MPTHRDDLLALSRITQACSWASPNVEIIVRDNSGSKAKREFLESIRRGNIANCEITMVEPCEATENFAKCLSSAKGDFVFFVADDDCSFDRAIGDLTAAAKILAAEPSAVGLVGLYIIERRQGSSIATYSPLDSDDVSSRVAAYLEFEGPNLLFYSPVRRQTALSCFEFVSAAPFQFSFRDQIMSLIYVLSGKFANIQRLMYLYNYGLWDEENVSQDLDMKSYLAAGMDPALNKLHWLLCAFEGAKIISSPKFCQNASSEERKATVDKWLEIMFRRFSSDSRVVRQSSLSSPVNVVCEKWRNAYPNISLDDLQNDICDFIALFSKPNAETYRDFWKSV